MKSHFQLSGFHQSFFFFPSNRNKGIIQFYFKTTVDTRAKQCQGRSQNPMASWWNLNAFGRCPVWGQKGRAACKATALCSSFPSVRYHAVSSYTNMTWNDIKQHISFTPWLEMTGAGHGFPSPALCAPLFAIDKVSPSPSLPPENIWHRCIRTDAFLLHPSLSSGASAAPLVDACFPSVYITALCQPQ